MNTQLQGRKFLKVTGILMIIFGGIGLIGSFIAAAAVSMVSSMLDGIDIGSIMTLMTLLTVFSFAGSIIQLASGILGVVFSAKQEKAMICMSAGIVVLVLGIASTLILPLMISRDPLLADSFNVNPLSVVSSAVLPVLFIIGAYKNKASNTNEFIETTSTEE